MGKKQSSPLTAIEKLRRLARAGVDDAPYVNRPTGNLDALSSLQERVDFLMGVVNNPRQSFSTTMIFFVMYDIESDKVRREVAKYLQEKGCFRIQKSIFLASLDRTVFDQIKSDLAEVQSLYDNSDSIIVCPVAGDEVRAMRVIGQSIDLDIITQSRNTLFF